MDLEMYLSVLTPQQETVVLLKDIKAMLAVIVERLEPVVITGPVVDPAVLIKDITPKETPFSRTVGKHKDKK